MGPPFELLKGSPIPRRAAVDQPVPRLVVAVRPRIVSIDSAARRDHDPDGSRPHARLFRGVGGSERPRRHRSGAVPGRAGDAPVAPRCSSCSPASPRISYGTSGRTVADVSRFLLTRWSLAHRHRVHRGASGLVLQFSTCTCSSPRYIRGARRLDGGAERLGLPATVGDCRHRACHDRRAATCSMASVRKSRRRRVIWNLLHRPRTVAAWACRQAYLQLSARSLDRCDGGGLCAWTGVQASTAPRAGASSYGSGR